MLERLDLAAACFALACGDEAGQADAVYVRLHNTSEFNFDSLSFRSQERAFGPLPAGAFSGFLKIEGIYSIEGGVGEAGALRFLGTVIDNLGDSLVGVGYHTYDVDAQLGSGPLGYDGGVVFFQAN
jgi:hypothetical protein